MIKTRSVTTSLVVDTYSEKYLSAVFTDLIRKRLRDMAEQLSDEIMKEISQKYEKRLTKRVQQTFDGKSETILTAILQPRKR